MSSVVLTLIAPSELKEGLVAAMLAYPPTAAAGFIAREVEGYGHNVDFDSILEQVRGHTLAVEIVVALSEAEARGLLDALADELPGRGIAWRMIAASGGVL
ncbi:DUF3240 family protein [Rhodopseudomonas palustris]|uniref:DUF3240 domain-containing protein n=1 Tax=Rhodopseudomonas palustris TaxID=1076 RepID=A0A418VLV0_RHOPL|nr:DUF3240 family protein [Rhodopseudomonas palustris]RJF77146.1 DUF3240 domain-containing protein [Rhodopseudomonas palustris]